MIRAVFLLLAAAAAECAQTNPQQALEAATAEMQAGRFADAESRLRAVLKQKPDFAEALFASAVCSIQLGRPAEAIPALRRYTQLEPKSADGHAVLGIVLMGEARFAEAEPELETAVRLDTSQWEATKALARLYTNVHGAPEKALPLLRSLVRSPLVDPEAHTLLASCLLRSGDAMGASAVLDRILAANSNSSPQVYILAATAKRKSDDIRGAMDICERAIKLYPNSERLESLYASLPPGALGERTAARLAALEKNPADVDELVAVGRVLISVEKARGSGSLEAAQQLFLRALKLAPGNAAGWYHLGRCLRLQNKPDSAIAAFQKAIPLTPDPELLTLIYTRLGVTEGRQENFEAAESAFRQAMQLNRKLPAHVPEAAFEYYRFLSMRSRDDEGRTILEEILRWEPLFAPARLERAKLLAAQDKPEEAIRDALLVTGNAEDPQLLKSAHYLLAKAYNTTGRKEQARIHQKWIETH